MVRRRLIITLDLVDSDLVDISTRRETATSYEYRVPARRRVDGILNLIRAMLRAERGRGRHV